ncbi:MAG: hypothetical protein AAGA18_02415 [Verrucomicrobiota bacterium]
MPQLKNREKRLIIMFGGILLLLGNYMLWEKMAMTRSQIIEDRKNLELHRREAEMWMKQRDEATAKRDWIQSHQPTMEIDSGVATSELLKLATDRAKEHELTIEKNSLGKTIPNSIYDEISIDLEATGSMEKITKWAHSIYSPSEFRLFKHFSLNSTADPDKLKIKVTVAQWFKPSGVLDNEDSE